MTRIEPRKPRFAIFVPEYRLAALDMEDPRINEGHRISMSAIGNISRRLSSVGNTKFLVVLIPTKLLAFSPQVDNPSATFTTLVAQEERM